MCVCARARVCTCVCVRASGKHNKHKTRPQNSPFARVCSSPPPLPLSLSLSLLLLLPPPTLFPGCAGGRGGGVRERARAAWGGEPPLLFTDLSVAGLPAELKHITQRRKRKQL